MPSFALAKPVVSTLQARMDGNSQTLRLQVNEEFTYKSFSLSNPDRVVVDVPSLTWNADAKQLDKTGLVRKIRVGHFSPIISRMVFEVSEPAKLTSASFERKKNKLFFLLEIASVSGTKSKKHTKTDWGDLVDKPSEAAEVLKHPEKAIAPLPTLVADSPPLTQDYMPANFPFERAPVPIEKPVQGEKVNLRMPTIVIDAGHGGNDPGAHGINGTWEKHITLATAQALAERLKSTGRYRVFLTRGDDRYIPLRERLQLGRTYKGDIFISIHADSAPDNETRGLSLYTLSDTASDKEAAALAARENKVDIIYGLNLSTQNQDVTEILIDLAQRETKNKSNRLAGALLQSLSDQIRLLPKTHRYAGFAVLKAPDVPSVLVELGFLSNRKDEALLSNLAYRKKLVDGLAKGIDAYFAK